MGHIDGIITEINNAKTAVGKIRVMGLFDGPMMAPEPDECLNGDTSSGSNCWNWIKSSQESSYHNIYTPANAHKTCAATETDIYKCFISDYILKYVKTPFVLRADMYDPYELTWAMWDSSYP